MTEIPPTTKPSGLSKGAKIGAVFVAAIVILIAAALLVSSSNKPNWISVKLLKNSDSSYDFCVGFKDQNDNEVVGVQGTGHLKITYEKEILYDEDFTIGSEDYTRKMPGIGQQPRCAYIYIPAGTIRKPYDEYAFEGRARVDFTTKSGTVFKDLQWDVFLPR